MEYTNSPFLKATALSLHCTSVPAIPPQSPLSPITAGQSAPSAAGDRLGCLRLSAVSFCSSATIWAARQHLPEPPPWGAFSGVRPSKIATRHLLSGGTAASADRQLRDDYFITPAPAQTLY